MAARIGRLVIIAAIGTGTIVTQQLVSATTIAVEQIDRTDSVLAELATTIDTINGPLSRLDSARETELDALASDIDAAIDRSFARVSMQLVGAPSSTPGVDQPTDERMAAARFGALALRAIDVERQAFVRSHQSRGVFGFRAISRERFPFDRAARAETGGDHPGSAGNPRGREVPSAEPG